MNCKLTVALKMRSTSYLLRLICMWNFAFHFYTLQWAPGQETHGTFPSLGRYFNKRLVGAVRSGLLEKIFLQST